MPRTGERFLQHVVSEHGHQVLRHYSSPYYDPVKAREYYLKTRELKGREKGEELSAKSRQKQAEGTAYVRNQVDTRRKADLGKNTAARDAQIAAHQARIQKLQDLAVETQERIQKKLTEKLDAIKENLKIPENASPKLKAFLEKQKVRQSNSAIKSSNEDLQSFRRALKTEINIARTEYRNSRKANSEERKGIVSKYKKDLETETQKIKDQVR